jgi:hypothetical protein
MVIPQPEPYNLVSTEGSDMDVSDDEVVIYDPPQTVIFFFYFLFFFHILRTIHHAL